MFPRTHRKTEGEYLSITMATTSAASRPPPTGPPSDNSRHHHNASSSSSKTGGGTQFVAAPPRRPPAAAGVSAAATTTSSSAGGHVPPPLSVGNGILKYDPPVDVSEDGVVHRRPKLLQLKALTHPGNGSGGGSGPRQGGGGGRLPPVEDILTCMFPPVVHKLPDGHTMTQSICSQTCSRLDAVRLQEALDDQVVRRMARDTGVCPVRSELYAEAFDELIRQVTLQNPEQGLLLLRIRDESYATVDAYRALYSTAVEFGNRKALTADHGLADLRRTSDRMADEKLALEIQVLELQAKCEDIDTQAQTQRLAREKAHGEELNFYRKTNHQLATQLKTENDKSHARKA